MRGRGVDFEQRFRTSRWAEDILLQALSGRAGLMAIRFGASTIRSPKELAAMRATDEKEPDLLVYDERTLNAREREFLRSTDLERLDRAVLEREEYAFTYRLALAAIEVEFSPYRAAEMRGRYWKPKTLDEWNRRPLKRAKPPTAPNIWVKEEDLPRLEIWQRRCGVPIVIAHLFDQEGFATLLNRIVDFRARFHQCTDAEDRKRAQVTEGIFYVTQRYGRDDADGASEHKAVFVVTPAVATRIGSVVDVRVEARMDVSASKKYVSKVLFSGGRVDLEGTFLALLRQARRLAEVG